MDERKLSQVAKQMIVSGKGLIAADESAGTCQKRFDAVGVPCTEENRRAYRQTLLMAPGIEEYVSGVILHDETIRQETSDGESFAAVLEKKGILSGIKVDAGTKDLALHPDEKVTEGLDGLRERLVEYKTLGAQFAKWRAVITIGKDMPSGACIHANAHALARYAALCQEIDIVPIIEPEVLIDGEHSIEQCYEASAAVLKKTFDELAGQDVALGGVILKASMVIAGKKAAKQSSIEEVATQTIKVLKESVPANLAGIVFLSGGQGDEQATENLNAMNKSGKLPWPLSFSYSRAIQNPVLKLWAENPSANMGSAQAALLFRSKMNSLASQGKYSSEMEKTRPY
ncbi:fructose-bisphosphate aldolase [Candidatus Kaiserbacteria bacterium RIFCSPHIGHO2_01_FULL_53_29]|uniref:Probable fructose-bisphosphate aldolase class 1 n=1 Tax=Candidatus Kaiserbacteria bacterium RIFCSPHIGHO2_01_FULL_53_29 TaxID=1798480 RepID=A0A1F6CTW4_9BACT|nr:MAG: fructose-bisphosphate aldolase [Candidatus Kaiserbacteria bacterium RIFCSPHIGHO2_01_FULL_53_29]